MTLPMAGRLQLSTEYGTVPDIRFAQRSSSVVFWLVVCMAKEAASCVFCKTREQPFGLLPVDRPET